MFRKMSKYIAALVLMLTWGAGASAQTLSAATLTVSGGEQVSGSIYDSGSITVTVNGYVKTLTGVRGYGQYSTVGSVASLIATHLSMDPSAPVWAKSTGAVITMVARGGGTVTVSGTTTHDSHFGSPSFVLSSGSTTVTPAPFLSLHCTRITMATSDTANCVSAIEGTSGLYGAPAATNSVAFQVNSAPWSSVPVGTDGTATAMGFSEGSAGTYTVRADYPGDSYYSAMHATTTITVGSSSSTGGVYSYSITGSSGSGYDPVGNIVGYADSVQGQWALSYDSLNRLARATSSTAIMGGAYGLCWQYDSFGNRIYQDLGTSAFSGGGTGSCSGGGTVTSNYEPVNTATNQIQSSSHAVISGGGGFTSAAYHYDVAGNLLNDENPGHSYAYDAEGRVCAEAINIVGTGVVFYGYLYDAEGRRVAKGMISGGSLDGSGNVTAATCNLSTHDFTVTSSYVIGPDGSTMTELDGSANWVHTDVPAGPGAMAVYDGSGLHFRLSDWLGSHRVQTSVDAATVEDTYQNLPFGEILNSPLGATHKHFTGKEHDAESGLDYFGARYYGSNMGRFISPDWSAKIEPVPYSILTDPQSLNLYSYVRNHPVTAVDADGHCCEDVLDDARQASAALPQAAPILMGLAYAAVIGKLAWDNRDEVADVMSKTIPNNLEGVPIHYSDPSLEQQAHGGAVPSNGSSAGAQPPNPYGQNGKPDHQAEVEKAAEEHRAVAKDGETVLVNRKIQGVDSKRIPDVQTVKNGRTIRITEVERRPNSIRNRLREAEYNRLGIKHETRPIPKP